MVYKLDDPGDGPVVWAVGIGSWQGSMGLENWRRGSLVGVPPFRWAPFGWPDLNNARDLGGIPTVDGGWIRERALIRTDNHALIRTDNHDPPDALGLAAIPSYGVSRIIDLRWPSEALKYQSPLSGDHRYRLMAACFDPSGEEDISSDSYRLMVDASRERLATVLTAIAEAPPGGVVVHCHAGRELWPRRRTRRPGRR
jgi:Tyrosine phosphatase family